MLHCIIFATILLRTAAMQSRPDCAGLDMVSCYLQNRCVWSGDSEGCLLENEIDCSEIDSVDECSKFQHCSWTKQDKCLDKAELNCSSLTSKLPCFALRKFGCHWMRIDDNLQCLHENDIPCEDLPTGFSCRQMKKCRWSREERRCVDGVPKVCPNCSKEECPIPECKDGEELVTPSGECCPTCANKQDCNLDECPTVKCFEGEEVVQEPGECCPKCMKRCLCPAPDCSKVLCPPSLPCPEDEEPLVLPGECCKVCVKSAIRCQGAKCRQRLSTCSIGEVIETPPGECCPTCRKPKTCTAEFEQPEVPAATCAKPDCSDVKCAKPKCEFFFGTNAIPEGECCPKCFSLFNCAACPALQCEEGERVVQDRGSCCPRCQKACGCEKPDCSLVKCPKKSCKPNEESVLESGGCCTTCVEKPSCDAPCGPPPVCNVGEVLMKEPGSCCPVCKDIPCVLGIEPIPAHCVQPDCADVECISNECGADEVEVVPTGSCCPECALKPECSGTSCEKLRCESGTFEFKDPRACCPECRKSCPQQ